ncbi:hypothetical protein [Qipengyuania nanhaisediminis]|uniref:hypothetical protein n=1 Tax=Qipengyuania nanhaisediminis TaxID=604088 RepID=UPI0038B3130B
MTDTITTTTRKTGSLAASATGLAALALFAAPAAMADDRAGMDSEMSKGEQRLAEMLDGRVAGEPQNCIRQRMSERMTVIDETAIVYGSGRTIYVQRTTSPEDIDSRDAMVSRRFNASQICRQDVVTTIDPFLGFFTGAVFFEKFVPYTRVEDSDG